MTRTHPHANDNEPQDRPEWYDDLVRQYDPFLRKSCKSGANFVFDEDLYQDTQIRLLTKWYLYRPGTSFFSFAHYAIRTTRRLSRANKPDVVYCEYSENEGIDGNQDVLALASVAMDGLSPIQSAEFCLYLQGYTFEEIGNARGVQKQAIHERFRRYTKKMNAANDNEPMAKAA